MAALTMMSLEYDGSITDIPEGNIMNIGSKRRRRAEWSLADLHQFPYQAEFFERLPDFEFDNLVADIERNGLTNPIEILDDNDAGLTPGTIISGHQRALALQKLGETTTSVLVRDDLAEASMADIEREFLEANVNRRQLHSLDKARAALRLFEIERNRGRGELDHDYETRDRVGKLIGVSGRTVSRYLQVLRTPPEVQRAFRNGEVSLVLAGKVAGLDQNAVIKISQRIANGEKAKAVMSEMMKPRPTVSQSSGAAPLNIAKLLDSLVIATLEQLTKIPGAKLKGHEDRLLKAAQLVREVQSMLPRKKPPRSAGAVFGM